MAIKVVPEVIQITAQGKVAGRNWASVWHMHNGAEFFGIASDVEEVVRDFANNWQDHIMEPLSHHVTLEGFQYLSLHDENGLTGFVPPDGGKRVTGGWQRDIAGPHTAYLVRKSTGSRRGARSGRAYLPGVAEEAIDNVGNVAAINITGMNVNLQAFLDGLSDTSNAGGSNRYPVVCHFPPEAREKGPLIVPGTATRISSLTIDPVCAVQRRRLR